MTLLAVSRATFGLAVLTTVGCASSSHKIAASSGLRSTVERLASFGTRHTLSQAVSTTRPERGIVPARQWLAAEMRAIEPAATAAAHRWTVVEQNVEITQPSARIPSPTTIVNVLGILEGTDPPATRKVIVISGHYDSRAADVMNSDVDAPGANDDGSGTAVVLEAARRLATTPWANRHTIVFALVAGEEQGLNGSAGLADYARQQGWPVMAMLTNDIVGNSRGGNGIIDDRHIRVFSEGVPTAESPVGIQHRQTYGGENDGPSRQLARYIAAVAHEDKSGAGVGVKLVYRRDRYGRGGDHIPFLRQGWPAVRLTEMNEDLSRQHADVVIKDGKPYGDLPEFVDYHYLSRVLHLNCQTVRSLASAPPPPEAVAIDPTPGDDVRLTWSATSKDIAGYLVLLRDSTEAQWSRVVPAGQKTSLTLKRLPGGKDDWQFGVVAVGPDGSESLPAVPGPKR